MKYFEVTAKCGHVSRNKYVLKKFYVKAENGCEAARRTRNFPRVKHDHKDAIREVIEITYEKYLEGIVDNSDDAYFIVSNKQDQIILGAVSECEKFDEDYLPKYKKKKNGQKRKHDVLKKFMKMSNKEFLRYV